VHCPSLVGETLINKSAYEALSDELKGQLETAIYAAHYKTSLWLYAENLEAVEFFKEQGVETVVMDPETVETLAKWAQEWMEEQAAQDEFFAKVWNSQKAFAEKWYPYIRTHTLPH
jgi:TRAP-type mannitol/chloroaromatic compound transport system substrate-binding protein